MESRELAKQICEALADKKGEDIKILNISEIRSRLWQIM